MYIVNILILVLDTFFNFLFRSRQSSTSSQNDKHAKFSKDEIRTKGEIFPEVYKYLASKMVAVFVYPFIYLINFLMCSSQWCMQD